MVAVEKRDRVDIVGDFEERLREADRLRDGSDTAVVAIAHYLSAFGHLLADRLLDEIETDDE